MLVSGGGGGLDLNWFLQFLFTLFIIAVGLLHLVKNTASKYFEVDANFESTTPRDTAIVIENSSSTTSNSSSSSSSSDHLHLSSPMPNGDTACAHCHNPATKKCSGCKAVRYCSPKCQEAHWKSEHKTKCKDLRPSGVNSTAGSGRKTSGLGGKGCSGIALVPAHGRGISKPIKQPKKILFPYEEFVNFFNWDKPGFPPCGLLNCGNSCYANVVLQCLAFTRPLVAYLLEKGHRTECNRDDWCFLCEFQIHVERASQSLQAFSPINILSRLPNIGGNLGYGRQEDAHEFMRFAIDTMQSVCLDEFGGEKAVDSRSQETTLIQHIFGGHLQSQVICTKCNNISNQYESMMDLTVEIHGDAASLEECLEQFTAKECLNGENKYKCDCCNDYVKAWKRLTVKKAPNILTIALKRFQSGRFGKLNKRVTFPETLNLSPYMSEPGDGTDVYKLYAVVVHLDLLNASFYGHYNCYTKDFRGNWYKIDDCKVTSVELKEVLSQEAYMLFYCRVSARPSCLRPIEPSVEQQQQMVQVTAAPCLKEQVECSTTVESLNHMNGFAVSSDDSSPPPKASSCEEESSTGINPVALKENHQDVEVVYVESSSVSKEVASCETESYFGISIEDLREDPEDINMTNSGSHSPISVEFSSHEKESSAANNSVAGREDPEDVNMADSEWCPAELKEVSCSEVDPVSMDCKFVREDSGDKEVESRPSVAKHAEVYGNGHIDQNEIPCREEHAHKPLSAETHKLKRIPPLHNSDCEDGNGAERVGIMGMAPDWSSIPVDLLRLVANKVHSLEDYVHFGAVCWSWYHAATSPKNNKLNSLFPWVMLADTENNDSHGFYSLSSNKVYEFDLPEIVGKRCWGSPFGWLVIAGIDNMEIQLFNPLSRASISLPSQTTFMGDENENSIMHYWSVNKVVISSNPPNCIVMAIYSCYTKLAFAKPGDHVWSKIRLDNNIGTGFSDITYFNGDFFIAKCTGQLLVCDFSGIDRVAIEFAPSPPGVAVEARYLPYLVDLGGELCMVFRYFDVIETINNISMKTRSFEVYKLDMNAKTWKQMDSLGDWSLFVGNNYTFSVRDFGYTDCRSSCIYFTHDYCQCSYQISGNDTGIYNYKGGEIHALPVLQDLYSVLRPPLWITPQLF